MIVWSKWIECYAPHGLKNAYKGQGMVEYAGALLVASAIVSALLITMPGTWSSLYQSVADGVSTNLGL